MPAPFPGVGKLDSVFGLIPILYFVVLVCCINITCKHDGQDRQFSLGERRIVHG